MKAFIQNLLNVRPGEGTLVWFLFLISFSKGIAVVFLESLTNSNFLLNFNANALPYAYILSGVVTIPIGLIYNAAESRIKPALVMTGSFFMLSLALFVFLILFLFFNSRELAFAMMVWKEVFWILTTLTFWAVAGMALNVRQAKRLFGLLGGGEILGLTLGGLSIPLLLDYIDSSMLLLISSGGGLVTYLLTVYTIRRFGRNFSRSDDSDTTHEMSLKEILNQDYVKLFFGISALSLVGLYFVDFVFYGEIEKQYTSGEELTRFFGIYFAALGGLQLISNVFISGRLLNHFGLVVGLVALPGVIFTGSMLALIAGVLGLAAVFYWVILGLKTLDESFRYSLEAPSFRVLYQPLGPALGLRIQTLRETILEPLAISVAGILILILQSLLELEALNFILILAVVSAAWIFIGLLLRSHYARRLLSGMTHGNVQGRVQQEPNIRDLIRGLESADEHEILYTLQYLEQVDYIDVDGLLGGLLDHPLAEIRIQALRIMEKHPGPEFAPLVKLKLEEVETGEVLGAALRTLCAVGQDDFREQAVRGLKHPHRAVRKGAIIGLVRYGGIDGVLEAGPHLKRLATSPDPRARIQLAEIVREVDNLGFFRLLVPLLLDDDHEVRRAAMLTCEAIRSPGCIPALVTNLSLPNLRPAAFRALLSYGPVAVPEIQRHLRTPGYITRPGIRLLGRIGGKEAISVLMRSFRWADADLREDIYAALTTCGFHARSSQERDRSVRRLRYEVHLAAHALQDRELLDPSRTVEREALMEEFEGARRRLFHLLLHIYGKENLQEARLGYFSGMAVRRSLAIEVLDNFADSEIKAQIMPVLDEMQYHKRLVRLQPYMQSLPDDTSQWHTIARIATREPSELSAFTRAVFLLELGRLRPEAGSEEYIKKIRLFLRDRSPAVRETAEFSLRHLVQLL